MLIREITQNDSEAFLKLLLQLDNETKYMLFEPNERPNDIEATRGRIAAAAASGSIIYAAFDNDKCIGFLSASRGGLKRIRHSAYIVIGILLEYQGRGIGKQLFTELDKWAKQVSVTRLELTLMTHNFAGVALYKKSGFEIEGVKRNAISVGGKYVDEYYMAKITSHSL